MNRIRKILIALFLFALAHVGHACAQIFVGPNGDDVFGTGTADAPYRTLTKATLVVIPGGTIHLLAGTYGAGESWPSVSVSPPPTPNAPNIPNGVSIVGDPGTVLSGGGADVALVFAGDGSAQGIEITGFQRGVMVGTGMVTLTGLYLHDNGLDGVYAFNSGTAYLADTRVSAHGWRGLTAYGTGLIFALGGRVDHNGTGAFASDSGYIVIWQTEVDNNGLGNDIPQTQGGMYMTAHGSLYVGPGSHVHDNRFAGIYASGDGSLEVHSSEIDNNGTGRWVTPLCSGVAIESRGPVFLGGGSVHDNSFGGISWTAADAQIDLEGVDIYSNEYYGVYAGGWRGGSLKARYTTIRNNRRYGLALGGSPGNIDFGYIADRYTSPGHNMIRDNQSLYEGTFYQIRDSRTAPNAFATTFYQTGVGLTFWWNGQVLYPDPPPPQDVWGTSGPPAVDMPGFWLVDNPCVHLLFE